MIIKCALDDDGCIDLLAVMRILNQINQEQAWAIAYELAALMQRLWPAGNCALIENLAQVFINKDGHIHQKSLFLPTASHQASTRPDNVVVLADQHLSKSNYQASSTKPSDTSPPSPIAVTRTTVQQHAPDHSQQRQQTIDSLRVDGQEPARAQQKVSSKLPPTPPITPEIELHDRRRALSEAELVSSLGIALFWALDFGIPEDEERKLSYSMEYLIMQSQSGHLRLNKVLDICIKRLPVPTKAQADQHYRAICRTLVSDTIELSILLDKIYTATLVMGCGAENDTDHLLTTLKVNDWARLWMQVIRELTSLHNNKANNNNSGSSTSNGSNNSSRASVSCD